LSAVGGALGLYIGFCGVTCFEILELIMLAVFAVLGWNVLQTGDERNDDLQQDLKTNPCHDQDTQRKINQNAWHDDKVMPSGVVSSFNQDDSAGKQLQENSSLFKNAMQSDMTKEDYLSVWATRVCYQPPKELRPEFRIDN
jgi:hypothetical protein